MTPTPPLRGPGRSLLAACALAVACWAAPPCPAADGPGVSDGSAYAVATVTYVSGSSVYIDAGRDQGLFVGDVLEYVVDGRVVATFEITDVSSGKAAARPVGDAAVTDVAVGARLRYLPSLPAVEARDEDEATERAKEKRERRRTGRRPLRGRVGVRYLVTRTEVEGATTEYAQPSLDLRLRGEQLGGGPWGLDVDARSRRSIRSFADGSSESEGRTRVYRAALRFDRDAPGWHMTLGRQYNAAFSGISLFDGVSAAYETSRTSVGIFTGTQPDPVDFGYDDRIREHGVYFEVRNAPGGSGPDRPAARWSFGTGAIGSYDSGEINREYLFLQGRFASKRLNLYANQEIDYNRDWKIDEGEDTISPTSSFVSLNLAATSRLSFNAGYDNRRSVRLYRDFVSPVTEFDDTFRRGVWVGTVARVGDHVSLGVDARRSSGGDAGDANSYTGRFNVSRVTSRRLDFRLRVTSYDSPLLEGRLSSLDIGVPFGRRVHLRVGGGLRNEDLVDGAASERDNLTWYDVDLDIDVGKRWYVILSGSRTDGPETVDQLYLSVLYRF